MKKWMVAIIISIGICIAGLIYFLNVVVFEACLKSGGQWISPMEGCQGGNDFAPAALLNPVSIAIFIGLALGIASALIQFHTLTKNITGFLSKGSDC